jgi:hypothetical protein
MRVELIALAGAAAKDGLATLAIALRETPLLGCHRQPELVDHYAT